MRILIVLAAIALMLILNACASKPVDKTQAKSDAPIPSREAIYVYSKQAELSRVVLKLSGEPLLLASGYVQLAGLVFGGEPVALLEVGGKGLIVKEGERINAYRVSRISGDSVILEKKS